MTYNRDEITNEIITKSLADAIEDSTPDILKSLRAELNIDSNAVKMANEGSASERAAAYKPVKAKNAAAHERSEQEGLSGRQAAKMRSVVYKAASCAAALIVLAGGVSLVNRTGPAFAVVGLDVNPGIEITIDKNEKVISAEAVNEEGQHILSDLKIEKSNVNSACDEVVEAMMDEGYLTDTSNSVLLSVRADDPDKGREIEKEISENLNGFLEDSDISPAIFGQFVETDDELNEFAGTHGISIGKAWLIRKLTDEEDLSVTSDSLLGLSTQELVLLGQDRSVSTGTSYGTPNTSKYVGTDSALIAALEAAGLNREDAQNVKVKFSCENGSIVYSVGFDANSCIYGFNVDALTGMVMLHDSVIPGVSAESPAGIGQMADAIDSLNFNSSGQDAQNNTEHQNTSGNSGNSGSGTENDNNGASDPGEITGDAQDIEDTDPDDKPGDISGDVEDIDDDTGDVPGENDSLEQDGPQSDIVPEVNKESGNTTEASDKTDSADTKKESEEKTLNKSDKESDL